MTPAEAPIIKPKNRRWYKLVDGVKHYECTACLEWKAEGAFYRKKGNGRKCKLTSNCRTCYDRRQKEYKRRSSLNAQFLFSGFQPALYPREDYFPSAFVALNFHAAYPLAEVRGYVDGEPDLPLVGKAAGGAPGSLSFHGKNYTR